MSDLHLIPDQELAASVKGGGAVPSWLALGEISRRQKVRASAPMAQAPEGTVADEVMGSLGQAAIMPQMPQAQSPAPAPSPAGGIMGASAPVIRRAVGGLIDDDGTPASEYPGGGLMPIAPVSPQASGLAPLDPSKYQVQYQAPAYIDPKEAESTIKARFGTGADYAPMLAEIQKLAKDQHTYDRKDAFRDIGAALMASDSMSPLQALGQGIQAARGNQTSINQKALENRRALIGDTLKISQDQQNRDDRIATHIDSYEQAQNGLRQNEAVQQNAIARGNAASARDIDQHNQQLQMQKDAAADKIAKEYADDPSFAEQKLAQAKSLLASPATQADPKKLSEAQAAVDSLTQAKDLAWASKKKADDEAFDKQKRVMDMQSVNALKLEHAKSADQYRNEIAKYKFTKGDTANDIAQGILHGAPYDPSIIGREFVGPVNAILAKSGFDSTKARSDWESTKSLTHTMNGVKMVNLKSQLSNVDMALDKVDTLSDQLQKDLHGVRPNITSLNSMIMNQAKDGKFGEKIKDSALMLQNQIVDMQDGLASIYKGGNSATDVGMKQAAELLNSNWGNGTLHKATSQARENLGYRKRSLSMITPDMLSDHGKDPGPAASGQSSSSADEMVSVVSPQGVRGKLPKSKIDEAIKRGFVKAQ